jgi:predicted XRE-type DNA-binding protein
MTTRRKKVEVGSGNIFLLTRESPSEDMLLKSTVVIERRRLIKQRKTTQSAAAKLIGISQGDLSKVLRGRFRGHSEAKLIRMVTAFGQDIEITTRPHRKRRSATAVRRPDYNTRGRRTAYAPAACQL